MRRILLFVSLIIGIIPFLPTETAAMMPEQRHQDVNLHWRLIPLPTQKGALGVFMLNPKKGWFIDSDHNLYQFDGEKWKCICLATGEKYSCIFALAENDIWLSYYYENQSSNKHNLKHYDGHRWRDFYTPNSDRILDLDFLSSDDGWAICEWGEILHYDGKRWQNVPSPTYFHLYGIDMLSSDDGWIVGGYDNVGCILHYDGKSWQLIIEAQGEEFDNVGFVSTIEGWALSSKNIWHFRSGRWQKLKPSAERISPVIFEIPPNQDHWIFVREGTVVKAHSDFWENRGVPHGQRQVLITGRWGNWILGSECQTIPFTTVEKKSLRMPPKQFRQQSLNNTIYEYGVAFGDVDGDGDIEIYTVDTEEANRLFSYPGNKGSHYVDATSKARLSGPIYSSSGRPYYDQGTTMADVDNDGDLDIYLTSLYGENILFKNNGNGVFKDVTKVAGVSGGMTRSNMGIWGDVDNDGDLDLFVTNEHSSNVLYLNNGAGIFKDVTAKANLVTPRGSVGATFGDIDNDGDLDLFVANFGFSNRLYRNEGVDPETGCPYFKNVTCECGLVDEDTTKRSNAAVFADIDNDGDLDLFVTNLVKSNRLYENDGTGHFCDITYQAGLADSGLSHGANFFDADHDGDLDLFVGNRGGNVYYENNGDGTFTDKTEEVGLRSGGYTTGSACGDLDNDGDIDLYVANYDERSIIYWNQQNDQNFLKLKLIGTRSNRDAIGAKVFLYQAGHLGERKFLKGMREVNGGSGYCSMNSTTLHFGVDASKSYDLRIIFPSGMEIIRKNVAAGQTLYIFEQEGWRRWVSESKRKFYATVNDRDFQSHCAKVPLLALTTLAVFLSVRQKGRYRKRTFLLFVAPPIALYFGFHALTSDRGFFLSEIFPLMMGFLSIGAILILSSHLRRQAFKESSLEELCLACNAFNHGEWATNNLNRLALFCTNISPQKPPSSEVKERLREAIVDFYDLVSREIRRVIRLCTAAGLSSERTKPLHKDHIALSTTLSAIKLDIAANTPIRSEALAAVPVLVQQIKDHLKMITREVEKSFQCGVIATINKVLRERNPRNDVKIQWDPDQFKEQIVKIRDTELAHIIDNLLSNAEQAVSASQRKKVTIKTSFDTDFVSIKISDTGCGIPPAVRKKIFDRDFTSAGDKNRGFGLYYARHTLAKYGGTIELKKSVVGKGSTFLVKLRKVEAN